MAAKVYSVKEVTAILAGVPCDPGGGFDEGDFVKITQDGAGFEDKVGCDGEVVRYPTNDDRATIELFLLQSSATNGLLSALYNLDKNAPNGAGIGAMLVQDRQGTSVFAAAESWISKPPEEVSFGKEASGRKWTFRCAKLERFDGSN